jgi:hypothetical protein
MESASIDAARGNWHFSANPGSLPEYSANGILHALTMGRTCVPAQNGEQAAYAIGAPVKTATPPADAARR